MPHKNSGEDSPEQSIGEPLSGVWVKTFGCQMNEYDSEKMLLLLSDKYRRVDSAEEAEVVIVNTCSVREKAEHKLYSMLGTLRDIKKKKPQLVIGVGGCVAQQEGEAIIKRSPSVDFVVGTHNLSLIPALVGRAKSGFGPQVAIDYREEWEELPDEMDSFPPSREIEGQLLFPPVRALVAVQRGCNKNCTFCVVPKTRGPQVSRALEEIEKEVKLKVRLGAKEVLLLGQTVNSYGLDLSPRVRFEELIRRLAKIDGLCRIRFTSPHPAEVRAGFVELYGEVEELCNHIHLPLQSGSDRILKLMNRNYRQKRYLQIVEQLRTRCPDLAITADIIVGFPTETDREFEQTLAVMNEVQYNSVYSFKYSRRPDTPALSSFSPEEEVSPEVAKERLYRLQELQDTISLEINRRKVGENIEVLVEGRSKKIASSMSGRIPENTPVELVNSTAKPGDLVRAVIEHHSPHGLRGREVGT